MANKTTKLFLAELFGTFVLVFGGCGSAIFAGANIGFAGVAIAFGLTLLVMAYTIGPISGCHINPAVTIGLWAAKKVEGNLVLPYIIAQVLGGILAAAVLYIVAIGKPDFAVGYGFATNGFGEHSPNQYGFLACLVAEMVLTALLLFTIMGTTHPKFPAGFGGLSIGLALMLIHLVGIPVTNTSVNPARSIGVAIFQGGWALGQLWLFIVAPIVGGLLGVWAYNGIIIKE